MLRPEGRTPDEVTAAAEQTIRRTAEVLAQHQTIATGLGEWCCKCSPMEWRPSALRPRHLAAALRDANLLADPTALRERDEALAAVERVRALAEEWDVLIDSHYYGDAVLVALGERP